MSTTGVLTGAGTGFLVGGPIGALVGGVAGGFATRGPTAQPVIAVPQADGSVAVTPVGAPTPAVVPNGISPVIPPSAAASADLVNRLTGAPLNYQPYPPAYAIQPDIPAQLGLSGIGSDLAGELPLFALGVISAAVLALIYFSDTKIKMVPWK